MGETPTDNRHKYKFCMCTYMHASTCLDISNKTDITEHNFATKRAKTHARNVKSFIKLAPVL